MGYFAVGSLFLLVIFGQAYPEAVLKFFAALAIIGALLASAGLWLSNYTVIVEVIPK